MLIQARKKSDVLSSEITLHSVFMRRREFLRAAAATSAAAAIGPFMLSDPAMAGMKLPNVQKTKWTRESLGKDDDLTPLKDVTTYNNFYEFGTGKGDPARKSKDFKTKPWTVVVDGETLLDVEVELQAATELLGTHQAPAAAGDGAGVHRPLADAAEGIVVHQRCIDPAINRDR